MRIFCAASHNAFLEGGLQIVFFIGGFVAIMIVVIIVVAVRQRGKRPISGVDEMIGMEGIVRTDLHPTGTIFIRSELWRANTGGETIEKGERVVVRKIEGLTLIVDKAVKGG
jgi:membrane-bound serine protease (ClpP class)